MPRRRAELALSRSRLSAATAVGIMVAAVAAVITVGTAVLPTRTPAAPGATPPATAAPGRPTGIAAGCGGAGDGTGPAGRSAAGTGGAAPCPVLPATATPAPGPVDGQPPKVPSARPSRPVQTVGPLFAGAVPGPHGCTASVVASPAHDLLVTAAHCVTAIGSGLSFVPGYDDGRAPFGVWRAVAVYLDPAWVRSGDQARDVAFLRVADQIHANRWVGVQDVVGGNVLQLAPTSGQAVQVVGYDGDLDQPVSCATRVYDTGEYPTFDCHGFVGGSSGSPWLVPAADGSGLAVVGVVGGAYGGGCDEATSLSPPFDQATVALWRRASAGGPSDTPPAPRPSGC